jgi:hypothetical protein
MKGRETKKAFGAVLMLIGVALGLYLGVWVCFIGGAAQVYNGFTAGSGISIGIGLLRFFASSLVGFVSGLVFFVPGLGMLTE